MNEFEGRGRTAFLNRPAQSGARGGIRGRALLAVTRLASRLPLRVSQSLGAGVGWLADHIPSKRRRVAGINIDSCFPHLTSEERRDLRRQVMMNSARFMSELPAAWFRSREFWANRLDTSAFDSLAGTLLARGKGLIIALPHLGNWELGIHGFAVTGGFTAMYRPPRSSALEPILWEGRTRADVRMAATDRSGLRTLIQTLRDGRAVVILPDQAPVRDQAGSVYAPFFGVPALTMTLLSQLAGRTGAPVLFTWFERGPAGRFTMHCFEPESAVASADPVEAATALNMAVQRCVERHPGQYQWTYKRFRRPPSGEPSIYDRERRS